MSAAWVWPEARSWIRGSLAAGGIGLVVSAIGAVVDPAQFFHSYLLAFMTWLAVALGSLPLLLLHHLTGGAWGFAIRRLLEAASRTLPLLALLFLPLLLGLSRNYAWASHREGHENVEHQIYFASPFFLGRAVVYFAVWLVIMFLQNRWSAAHDRTGDPAYVRRAQAFGGPGLILYGMTITFAGIDWVMSLDADWYSTIFGPVVAMGQMLPAFALAVATATCLARRQPLADAFNPTVWNDLGNLLMAFVMLWTYMALSQFMVIWSGNLPEEITWYLARSEGGWIWVAIALALFNFAFPFLYLLSRDNKREPVRLRRVALLLVAMSLVNQFWLIAPAFSPGAFRLSWQDIAAQIGVGGIWLAVYLWQIQARPLVPLHPDAVREEVLGHV